MTPGRVETRFEVLHPEYGLIETAPTSREALEIARRVLEDPKWDYSFVEVYDVMAHIGAVQLFRLERDPELGPSVCLVLRRTE